MRRQPYNVSAIPPPILALAFLLLLGATGPVLAQGPQAITIDSKLSIKQHSYIPIIKAQPFASVVLLAGGNGVLDLNASGNIRELQGNFLIRSARRFLGAGLNVAMLDAAPNFPGPNGLNNQRLTQAHADHLAQVIAAVRKRWPGKAVWLVGTSNGTLSALNAAARLTPPDGPRGIVLTSSITQSDAPGEMGTVLGANPGLPNVTVPTLVMWHSNDACSLSPASGAAAVFAGLTKVRIWNKSKQVIVGKSANIAVPGCSAFHHHGYSGVEQTAVDAIANFIRYHGHLKKGLRLKKADLHLTIDNDVK